jgi:hypothetical protein
MDMGSVTYRKIWYLAPTNLRSISWLHFRLWFCDISFVDSGNVGFVRVIFAVLDLLVLVDVYFFV